MSQPVECQSTIERARSANPFRSAKLRPGVIPYFFQDRTTVELLLERFESLGRFAEIVGPHGTGKSTLVEMLAKAWVSDGREVVCFHLRNDQRRLPFQREDWIKRRRRNLILIIDGAEQLAISTRWMWRVRCRRFGWGLLLTTHESLGAPHLWSTASSPEIAKFVVHALLHQEYPGAKIDDETLTKLLLKHNGNLRETLFSFYDFWRTDA